MSSLSHWLNFYSRLGVQLQKPITGARRPNGAQRDAATTEVTVRRRKTRLVHETPAPDSTSRREPRISSRPATGTPKQPVAPLAADGVAPARPPARPLHLPCSGLVLNQPAAIDAALHRQRPPHVPLELWLQMLSEDT